MKESDVIPKETPNRLALFTIKDRKAGDFLEYMGDFRHNATTTATDGRIMCVELTPPPGDTRKWYLKAATGLPAAFANDPAYSEHTKHIKPNAELVEVLTTEWSPSRVILQITEDITATRDKPVEIWCFYNAARHQKKGPNARQPKRQVLEANLAAGKLHPKGKPRQKTPKRRTKPKKRKTIASSDSDSDLVDSTKVPNKKQKRDDEDDEAEVDQDADNPGDADDDGGDDDSDGWGNPPPSDAEAAEADTEDAEAAETEDAEAAETGKAADTEE